MEMFLVEPIKLMERVRRFKLLITLNLISIKIKTSEH
jgi:hypothetical protein